MKTNQFAQQQSARQQPTARQKIKEEMNEIENNYNKHTK